jgi:hypothetical protein
MAQDQGAGGEQEVDVFVPALVPDTASSAPFNATF